MKIFVNVEKLRPEDEEAFMKMLGPHGRIQITYSENGAEVAAEGTMVDCMCVVSICDLFRFSDGKSMVKKWEDENV